MKKKSYQLFYIWLIGFVIIMTCYILSGWKSPLGGGKTVGLLTMAGIDVLFLLIRVTQSIYWISGITYEMAVDAGAEARKAYARRHLIVFLAVTVAYLIYCFAWPLETKSVEDSITAAALVCIAVLLTVRIRL